MMGNIEIFSCEITVSWSLIDNEGVPRHRALMADNGLKYTLELADDSNDFIKYSKRTEQASFTQSTSHFRPPFSYFYYKNWNWNLRAWNIENYR